MLLGVWNNPLKEFKNSKDPDVKVMLAVGGQDYTIRRANELIGKEEFRQKFVISTTKLLRTHEFDGIDLNFEHNEALGPPSSPNQQVIDDKKKLVTLCKVRFFYTLSMKFHFSILILKFIGTPGRIRRRSW